MSDASAHAKARGGKTVYGAVVGILMLGVKMMLLAIVAYLVYSLIFKRRKERAENA